MSPRWFFLCKMAVSKMAEFKMRMPSSSLSQIELIWVRVRMEWECFWVNLREDNKVSESKLALCWIQDGRIQDGCHNLVSQIELVWVRVRMEWECFWVNLREDNKVSEYKMAVSESKMAVSECNMAEFKMAAFIKLSENEWVWVRMN